MTLAADRDGTDFWFHLHLLAPVLLGLWAGDRLGYLKRYPPATRKACIEAFDTWGKADDRWPSDEFRRVATTLLDLG